MEQQPLSRPRSTGVVLACCIVALSLIGAAPPASAAGQPPVAVADTVTVPSGQAVTVSPLANDIDPESDALTLVAASVSTAGAGTAAVVGSDVVISTTPGFVGTLDAAYEVSDGTSSSIGAITVTVTNNPPVANPDWASMYAPGELRVEPLANDTDPDGDALTLTSATLTTPGAGSVSIEGNVVVVRSTAGFSGPLAIAYLVTDARGAQAQGTLSVDVLGPAPNRAPVAGADTATVRVGRTVRVKVLANDSDPDGDRIRLVKVSTVKRGTATRAGSSVKFRAPASWTGKVRVRYTIKDARGATDRGVLTITVTRKRPGTTAPPASGGDVTRRAVESALARLGLPVGAADGAYDARTRRAVCAWRTVMGRSAHRGLPTAAEASALVDATGLPPARAAMVTGVTVSVTCQAAFWVGPNREYRRIMPASTGKAGYRTRLGTHRIFITHRTWRYSTIYREARMYKPMQFSGGQAMHGSATDALVKTYPASHGCVRMLHRDVDAMQAGGVGNGTLVRVIGSW